MGLTCMVILRDSGLAGYVVVLDNKMTLSFDLDLKANQATNDLIYYYMYLYVPSAIVLQAFESTSDCACNDIHLGLLL